jgi:DNA-binding GntR family transcriptional regulator
MRQFKIDTYVMETLLRDLVLHDHQPSAFLIYLFLWYRSAGRKAGVRASHRDMVDATGLSKSAVQGAIRTLARRMLIRSKRESATAVPEYRVLRPWRA